jgi:anhydro-N-acetylmuramic acid kinase
LASRAIIGLASGSSIDGVDAALFEAAGVGLEMRVQPILALHQPYAAELRALIRKTNAAGNVAGKEVGLVHRLLGETFAAAARQVADRASMSLQRVQCIGCPGYTIWHDASGRFPSTFSLGMPAVVAERTGVTTVSDFAARDLAVGGEGAPLVALPDFLLLSHAKEERALIHLGGLARIVYLPARGRVQDVIGFEAGPCGVLLDGLMQTLTVGREELDAGGKHGVQGHCIDSLRQRWLANPYFRRRPPKSVPHHGFVEEFINQAIQFARQSSPSLHDLMCTATHFVAGVIAGAVRRFLPETQASRRYLVSGGGVRNGLLWQLLAQQLDNGTLEKTDSYGVPADAREALGFGILAALTLDGVPGNVPASTGAAGSRLLGSLTPGSSVNWARCLTWMADQTVPTDIDSD